MNDDMYPTPHQPRGPFRPQGRNGPPSPHYAPSQQQPPPQWAPMGAHAPPPAPPKKRRKWPWVVGAVLLLFVVVGLATGGDEVPPTPTSLPSAPAAQAPAGADDAQQPAPSGGGSTVVYEVTGRDTASVTYMKEGFAQEQQTSAKLPFRKELQFEDEVGAFAPLSLVAQNNGSGGDITCRITVDGEVVGESTSSGQYAVVTCNGNG